MSTKLKTFIDEKTYIPITLVIMTLGAAITSGMALQKIESIKDAQIEFKKESRENFNTINAKVDELTKLVYKLDARDVATTNNLRTIREN